MLYGRRDSRHFNKTTNDNGIIYLLLLICKMIWFGINVSKIKTNVI